MNTKEKIVNLLNEKINDVFFEMQNTMDIEDGNIFPLDAFELENYIEQLADKIEVILNTQKN